MKFLRDRHQFAGALVACTLVAGTLLGATAAHAANPPVSDGLRENPCWPKKLAPDDPGFALMTWDPFYKGNPPPYDYKAKVNATPMPKIPGAIIPRTVGATALPRTTLVTRTAADVTLTAQTVTSMPEVTPMPDCSSCGGDEGYDGYDDVEEY